MDSRQFAEEFEAAYRRLWLVAMAVTTNHSEAEDILQDAACTAFSKLETFREGSNFAAWMARIVRFTAANHRRKTIHRTKRIRATDPAALDEMSKTGANDESATQLATDFGDGSRVHDAFDDQLLHALKKLPEDARLCLLLRVLDELSYAEIASVVGVPENTAMSHVHRSKAKLRKAYGDFVGRLGVPGE